MPGSQENDISLKSRFLHNTKILGSAINEANEKSKQRDRKAPIEIAIGFLEIYMKAIDEPCVRSDLRYIEISTNIC